MARFDHAVSLVKNKEPQVLYLTGQLVILRHTSVLSHIQMQHVCVPPARYPIDDRESRLERRPRARECDAASARTSLLQQRRRSQVVGASACPRQSPQLPSLSPFPYPSLKKLLTRGAGRREEEKKVRVGQCVGDDLINLGPGFQQPLS